MSRHHLDTSHFAAFLRKASRCPPSHSIIAKLLDTSAFGGLLLVNHHGILHEYPIEDLDDVEYDAWAAVLSRWLPDAAEDHRKDAFASDLAGVLR